MINVHDDYFLPIHLNFEIEFAKSCISEYSKKSEYSKIREY